MLFSEEDVVFIEKVQHLVKNLWCDDVKIHVVYIMEMRSFQALSDDSNIVI